MNDIVGTFGLALLIAGLPLLLCRYRGGDPRTQAMVWFGTAVLSLTPFFHGSLVFFMRGILGDVSIATLALLIMLYYQLLVINRPRPSSWLLSLIIVMLLGTLYASTTGYLAFDLYGLGYEPCWLLIPCLVLLLMAWCCDRLQALAWLMGVMTFASRLSPTQNLWDALFDGYAFVGAVVMLLWHLAGYARTSRDKDAVDNEPSDRRCQEG